jgi:hypothetical protein
MAIFVASSFRLHPVKTGCDARALVDFAWVSSADMNLRWLSGMVLAILVIMCGAVELAFAQSFAARPQSCVLVVTSQYDDCTVDQRYRCAESGDSFLWIESHDSHGLTGVSRTDANYAFTSTQDAWGEGIFLETIESTHPRDTLRTGVGQHRGVGHFTLFGIEKPISVSEMMTYDGEIARAADRDFHKITAQIEVIMPQPMVAVTGYTVYGYLPEDDILVELEYQLQLLGGAGDVTRLISAATAGQDGFGSQVPEFGCAGLS